MIGRGDRGKRQIARRIALIVLAATVATAAALLSMGGVAPQSGPAANARARFEAAAAQARADGLPAATIAPFIAREKHIDGLAMPLLGPSDADLAASYDQLESDLAQAEQNALAAAQQRGQDDFASLIVAGQQASASGISSPLFIIWQGQAQSALSAARTVGDYLALDRQLADDLNTASAMMTTHAALSQFTDAVGRLQGSGLPLGLAQAELNQDESDFLAADNADGFTRLNDTIQAGLVGLISDQVQAIPYVGTALLDTFQQRLDLARSFGENVAPWSSEIASDQRVLPGVTTFVQYMAFSSRVQSQMDALSLPLARGQARTDLAQLRSLVAYCASHQIMDYEYSSDLGFAQATSDFNAAVTAADFHAVDDEVTVLLENLRSMIANLSDATPADQAHAADLALMSYYQIAGGKAIVVSLREQVARLYDNGQLVMWTYVTTGRPKRPTPPGLWHVLDRQQNVTFVSSDPPGSPLWYAPTTVRFALLFHEGGFFLHDAWWRSTFGPGTNLPHDDPGADNDGSHGCINTPLQPMGLIFDWATLGTPIVVY
jgi:hypothetical protein